MLTKAMLELDLEPGDTNDLFPMTPRSRNDFNDLYPLSLKRMREEQEKDSVLMEKVSKAIANKDNYQR